MAGYLTVQVQYADGATWRFLELARPKVLQWMDWSPSGLEMLKSYRALEPGHLAIGRKITLGGGGPDVLWSDTLSTIDGRCGFLPPGGIHAWLVLNEPQPTDPATMATLATWYVAKMRSAPAGFRGIIGNFSEGTPRGTPADPTGRKSWEAFYPALAEAVVLEWWLGIHEYDCPRMDTTHPWRCGRFLTLIWPNLPTAYRHTLADGRVVTVNLKDIIVWVSETGIDGGVDHSGETLPFGTGWQGVRKHTGWQAYADEASYREQLAWYAGLWRPYPAGPRLAGAAIFLCGAYPGGEWPTFDVKGCDSVAALIRAQPAPALPAPAPEPPLTPPAAKPAPPPAPAGSGSTGGEGTTVAKLWIALIPSNQATNPCCAIYSNEQQQMEAFADTFAKVAAGYPLLNVRVVKGGPETDTKNLPKLKAQQAEAAAWLNTAPAGTLTLALNLHSDSGDYRHVGAYYGMTDVSKRLATALLPVLAKQFDVTKTLSADYGAQGYLAWTCMPDGGRRHCPVILELGTHTISQDVWLLKNSAWPISRAILTALLAFFGLSTAPAQPSTPGPAADPRSKAIAALAAAIAKSEAALSEAKAALGRLRAAGG